MDAIPFEVDLHQILENLNSPNSISNFRKIFDIEFRSDYLDCYAPYEWKTIDFKSSTKKDLPRLTVPNAFIEMSNVDPDTAFIKNMLLYFFGGEEDKESFAALSLSFNIF
ncbi:hypothetical protein H5410_019228 [Solanum commersonii]|uniref:Uncharacterized protein n=1 Tax=Solanum commersonii TaxID=4109 RepID=A0A9J6A5D3_SOLCO|nr:hypothetical protein H5410_019228 [Solanum commersonii]